MAKILIIDDDSGFRKLLETILTGEGYDITAGGSVAEARKLGAAEQFDLVLSDLKLPDGDGLQVLGWFAENAPRTAMVMLTAPDSSADNDSICSAAQVSTSLMR